MNKILVKRMVIGIVGALVLFTAYKLFEKWTLDPDTGNFDSTGFITAIEYTGVGSQIVYFDADGKKTVAPDIEPGIMDLDPVWRPDGQRIFFISNRDNQPYNIFRWNPAKNKVEQRSHGSRSKSSLHFGPPDWPNLNDSALITVSGTVLEFNQRLQRTWQVLPPTNFEGTMDENAVGQFNSMYGRIGTSFKAAMWGAGRKVIYAVMRRESGEVFIVNYMEDIGDIPAGPYALYRADTIQFDVGSDGTAVVSIKGFQFNDQEPIPPQFIKDGIAYKPYSNGTFVVQVSDDGALNLFTLDRDQADFGIQPGEMNDAHREEHAIPAEIDGVIVDYVEPKFAAANIGMEIGDVILSVNGEETKTPEDMFIALSEVLIGEPVQIIYYAGGEDAGVRQVTYAFGQEPTRALSDPAISPDSTMLAAAVGFVEEGTNFRAYELVLLPLNNTGSSQLIHLVPGSVFEPRWHPDGMSLVYAKAGPAGDSQVYTINIDGSNEKNVSGIGDYGRPSFSPILRE